MRNHPPPRPQQQLLLTLASLQCFIIFIALLLINLQQLAEADNGTLSCYSPALNLINCPLFQKPPRPKNISTFPFFSTSQASCGGGSSFALSGCDNAQPKYPSWPNFVRATTPVFPSVPLVMGLSQLASDRFINSSNHSNSANSIYKDTTTSGSINLTWSNTLIYQKACESLVSLNNISHHLPQSIDLTSFAQSSFQFSPSNVILLFNCSKSLSSVSDKSPFQKNSTACRSYETDCKLPKRESPNCYQYMPEKKSRLLNVSRAMESLDCESAMFFVVLNFSSPASPWSPGLIQLNWSTNSNHWMASNLELCKGCLQTSGACGYNDTDNFLCYCADDKYHSSNCTADSTANHPSSGNKSFKYKYIGWIAFGAAGFAIALCLSFILFCIWRRKVFMKTNVPSSSPFMNKSWMKKPSFLWRKQDPILAKEMSYQEIMHATESFADKHVLGDGGFGAVYKGVLADGRKVAVKRLHHDNYRRMEHFFNEIKVLSNLNHPNLVKLYGFCYEDEKELLLVFEYASQGTVSDQLHDASKPPMSWKLRLNIACETAEALSYLHNSVVPPIYHRDVKTTNILLDEMFHVKLADFGLSKFVPLKATHVSTAPQGTPGYLDPDYHQCYQLTDKSDVYSFGVVLMELISAKLAVDMSRGRGEINLSTLAVMKIQCGQLDELVDPTLEMQKNPCVERSIKRVVEVAFQCLHAERDERPSMSSVAETLAGICREHADDEAEALLNVHINTRSTPTACESCVSNGSNKPFRYSQDSSCSVFFSSTSSSNLSSS